MPNLALRNFRSWKISWKLAKKRGLYKLALYKGYALSEKIQKKNLWNFFDSGSISCVVTSFYQIQLTWWKFYPYLPILSFGLANVTGFTPHSVYLNGSYKTKIIISVDTSQFSKPSGLYDFSTVWTCLHPLFLSRILLAPATTLKKVVFKH